MKKNSEEKIIFACIIFIAAILRFWNYWDYSYTHDELSQLIRLRYASFSELITKGVLTDVHPALIQVFLFYWTKLFGDSEAAVRFPFVIAGIASVGLVYLLTKKWFGVTSAYFSSLTLAVLDFPILYSQVARPYSLGLFFSMLAVLFWTNLLFGSGKRKYFTGIAYGIATALCMFTHYFSFFFSMLVAATGIFFLKKETWKPYILSGIISLIIFFPHISISFHQFAMGGVGEWLAPPDHDFLRKFILYAFNDSPLVVITVAILFVLSVLFYHINISVSKFHLICIVWFILPFIAGYYYSVNVNPVLQYSTLLFSFPFLLSVVFSFLKEPSHFGGLGGFNAILLASAGIILLYSTIIEQKFYKREYFGVFKEIDKTVIYLQKKYGSSNVTTVLNTTEKEKFDFYFKKWNASVQYDFYHGDDSLFIPGMLRKIAPCTTPYFLYGWSNCRSPYEIPELIKRNFPCILYDEKHFNSQITLFGKNGSCSRDTIFFAHIVFENPETKKNRIEKIFSYDINKTDTLYAHSGKYSLQVGLHDEFCITLKTSVKKLFINNSGCVNISAWIHPLGKFNAQMVMEVGEPNTKKDWMAKPLLQFVKPEKDITSINIQPPAPAPDKKFSGNRWQEVFATFEIPPSAYPDDEVAIYLWNPEKNSFYLDDFTVSSFADSHYDYYAPSFRK